ncbi:ABC-type multidrug transport system, ATPase and permease component [Aquiflexum balticum DSM 16537]|uniref:ABC-type multidrug transport system, ATPase and permease component n=1 Tax=Aquiflexum balticum DSM 16537 TaxID=758820 RepID=A0A1W2HBQ7_9BACT|nr:ABC transporter ATP-binding protein [Aquiflexum balticum]SMD46310.1 ABC-type multidrug transport system, ATPase and permease component [Aquiflexum balticum DSM 16537]
MKNKQNFINKLSDFLFYYSYLGNKIFASLGLSFFVGLLDGLGLAMFIPLLQLVDGGDMYDAKSGSAGNMDFFIKGLDSIGLSLNLITVLFLILLFFSLKGFFRFFQSYYNVVLTTTFVKKIRTEAVDSISNLKYGHFIRMDSGKIQNSISGEIDRVKISYTNYSSAIQAFMSVMVYISLAFLTNPQFAILVAIGGALSNFLYTSLYKKTKKTSKEITSVNHIFYGLMLEQVHNFKYLRATGQITVYGQKLKKTIIDIAAGFRKMGFYNSLLISTKEPLSISVVVIVIIIQTYYFSTELGPIILSLLFFYRSLNQVIVFQNYWNDFLNYSGSLSSYKDFICELKANELNYSDGLKVNIIETITLKDVEFSYDNKLFLQNINIEIKRNMTVAFVGSSGSGKTTLSNIITGLLPIGKGELLINGNNLNISNIQQYQTRIGYITQEPVIFNDTLFNNITFWAEKTPDNLARFKESLRKASLLEYFEKLEQGENTPLGNNGVLISGGQKQRIAIARELYKNIDLLVLDEATSALDSSTEKEIQEYFEELKGRFTFIIIAHRLSTIKHADVIYLLKDGKIEAEGDFYSLQKKSTEFRKMVLLQDFGSLQKEKHL